MQFDLTFEGNVADAPELSLTPSGKALCRFRVGHNTRRRTGDGQWVNGPTVWFTVTAWETLAERIADSIRMGDTVLVNARNDLSVFAYLNQNTQKPSGTLQVTAANVSISLRFATGQSHRRPKDTPADAEAWADASPAEAAHTDADAQLTAEPAF